MTEEVGQTETSTETETIEVPGAVIDEEGNFVENWTHRLKDESLHDDATLKTLKSLDMLAGNHVLQRKKIGGNTVLVPNESSTEQEWDEFHKAGGRPDTAADYNFTRPEEVPEEYYSEPLAQAAQELFHKIGLSKKQADLIFEFNNNNVLARLKAKTEADQVTYKEAEDALYKEWGNAFEERKHLGNVAVEKGTGGDEEFKTRLCGKFGNDPDFVKFTSNLGKMFAEHGDVAVPGVPTPSDIQQQIDEVMVHPSYGVDFRKHGFTKEQHEAQIEKGARLFRAKVESTAKRKA